MIRFFKLTWLTLALLLASFYTSSQNLSDSLSKIFNQLNFHSDFEKSSFFSYFENPNASSSLKLFWVADKRSSVKNFEACEKEFNTLIESLKKSPKIKKSNRKKIKYIFNYIHEYLLIKYDANATFYDVVTTGRYNCLSASILYALVFEALKIPYQSSFTENHVFLIAYPESDRIVVETTNPLHGTFIYTNNKKRHFADYLQEMKLITAEERYSESLDTLFRRHYTNIYTGSLPKLIATQYYNIGLLYEENKQSRPAFDNFEKALEFDHTPQTRLMAIISGNNILEGYKYDSEDDIEYHIALAKILKRYTGRDILLNYWKDITFNYLAKQNNPIVYDKVHQKTLSLIEDTVWLKDINYIYYHERIRNLQLASDYRKALFLAIKGFLLLPSNSTIQRLLTANTYNYIKKGNPIESFENLKAITDTVPKMLEIDPINKLYRQLLLESASYSFYMGDNENAFHYIDLFEVGLNDDIIFDYDDYQLIDKAYRSAGQSYFNQKNYKKAREYFTRGLKIHPESHVLKSTLYQINKYYK